MVFSGSSLLRSFRAQTAGVFGGIIVALAFTLSFSLGNMLEAQAKRAEGEALRAITLNISKTLTEGIGDRVREVEVLARSESLWAHGLQSPAVQQALAQSRAVTPSNAWIGVADISGRVMTAADNLLLGASVAERPWFQHGLAGLYVGDVHPAKLLARYMPPTSTGEPPRFVDFAAPISVHGRIVGVIGVHGSWEWAQTVVKPLMPEHARERRLDAFIFDHAGALLHAPPGVLPADAEHAQMLPFPPKATPSDESVKVARWADGRDYLTAVTRVDATHQAGDLGWVVVAREPVEIALSQAQSVARNTRLLGIVAALLAAGFAWATVTRMATQLSSIANAAEDVRRGAPGAVIPLLGGTIELERLSSALSAMTNRLVASNADLDSMVKERTRALEMANSELSNLALRDALTGLFNRRAFDEQFARMIALARRSGNELAVLMVDVDHFKRVNDTHGHSIGDEVLRALGRTLLGRLRDSDVIARLGGEEFVALLPDTTLEGARIAAQTLLERVAATPIHEVGHITISIGVAGLRHVTDTPDSLLKRADEAVYAAKRGGRNRVSVEGTLTAAAEPARTPAHLR